MNKKFINIINRLFLITLMASLLVACGQKEQVDEEKLAYRTALTEYYNQINATSVSINNIDFTQPGSQALLLSYLDTMSISFNNLAALSCPARYEPLKPLAAEANDSFMQASLIYHEIYSDESMAAFDADKAVTAGTYYQDAMNKLVQLGRSIMNDEHPEAVSNNAPVTQNN